MASQPERLAVAVVGGGYSGISSFWALQNSGHDVHLFEASTSLGGRIQSRSFEGSGSLLDIDAPSSFNAATSPNFVSLLRCLGVSTSPDALGFCASAGASTFEWDLSALKSVSRHPRILCNWETYRILFDIVRFRHLAADVLADRSCSDKSHGGQPLPTAQDYLAREGFSNSFRDRYLVPLLSMLWGLDAGRTLSHFPMRTLCQLLQRHRLLSGSHRGTKWKRIDYGANQFIQGMLRGLPAAKVHLQTRVSAARPRGKGRFILLTSDGAQRPFDHVVFAVDAQECIRILDSAAAPKELDVLQELRGSGSRHIAVLHSDPGLMPRKHRRRPSFDYILSNDPSANSSVSRKTCLSYNMSTRPNTSANRPSVSLTLDPFTPPDPRFVHAIWEYTDWKVDSTTLTALRLLPSIQDKRGLSFCAAWSGSGFFEDAVTAGLAIAVDHLGAELPFALEHHRWDEIELEDLGIGVRRHLVRTLVGLVRAYVLVLEIFWAILRILLASATKMRRNSKERIGRLTTM
ncbi:amine oxidase [Aspergillus sp. HF37]|nr:amine oxidase [Aspergillus sp. HF37]